ncbi:P2 GpU family protein [Rhizobium sp. CF080]|uniref:phage tail protein n=1 Tax=Rhizobium sp. (strain CF080) TaxID=1144310 RepID=UPI000271B4B2|nr:phage tail protein [Rhizobium sp. CF080]EUB97317.1 P2 GpU family protein [Rhizobium sp. CF080]
MLMAWGSYRFTVPNYSVETLRRSIEARVEPQNIIGAAPSLHRLGPGNEKLTLSSTFHPRHLNGRGLEQLAGVRQAVNALVPLPLVHINGAGMNIFGNWIATSVEDEQTVLDNAGTPQMVTVTMNLTRDDTSAARSMAISAVLGGINFSVRLGF